MLPKTPEEIEYKEIVETLEDHFDPKSNEILENYRFYMRKQKSEENCAEFLIALRRMSVGCNFGAHLDTAIRNQFVFGLRNQKFKAGCWKKQN